MFQCSSASRKFLNRCSTKALFCAAGGFSALQRAENSSMLRYARRIRYLRFQCSSASRKFLNHVYGLRERFAGVEVSVLFSEPKIPQYDGIDAQSGDAHPFQCSSASRKFLNGFLRKSGDVGVGMFQCSSASRKFLNRAAIVERKRSVPRFSALQRAENSSICVLRDASYWVDRFSALQRAENSSIPTLAPASIHISDRDDHASSFLSLPGASP